MAISSLAFGQVNWLNNPVGAVFSREGGESPQGTFRLSSDGVEVFTLITSDQTEFYQPASLFYGPNDADKAKVDALAPSGKVASSMNCFAVRVDGNIFLVDTGLPSSRQGKTLDQLDSLGIKLTDIDAVFITHSHFDHIGGLFEADGKPSFPNATVFISSKEWDYMESNMADMASQIKEHYKLAVFEPGGVLPYGVLPIDAPGHTPGHTVYQLGSLLFVGDILHGMAVQLIDPEICANFDMNCTESIASREKILRYAASRSLTVLGAHVPNNGVIF